jgi:hypothetical protein
MRLTCLLSVVSVEFNPILGRVGILGGLNESRAASSAWVQNRALGRIWELQEPPNPFSLFDRQGVVPETETRRVPHFFPPIAAFAVTL